jgi:hypothetical protein
LCTPLLAAAAAAVHPLLNPVWTVGAAPLSSSLLQHIHLLLIFNFPEEREKMKRTFLGFPVRGPGSVALRLSQDSDAVEQ